MTIFKSDGFIEGWILGGPNHYLTLIRSRVNKTVGIRSPIIPGRSLATWNGLCKISPKTLLKDTNILHDFPHDFENYTEIEAWTSEIVSQITHSPKQEYKVTHFLENATTYSGDHGYLFEVYDTKRNGLGNYLVLRGTLSMYVIGITAPILEDKKIHLINAITKDIEADAIQVGSYINSIVGGRTDLLYNNGNPSY